MGGISGSFVRAFQTEAYLVGKNLNDNETLQAALAIMDSEVNPNPDPVLASVEYRKYLAKALFYKVKWSI